MNPPNASSGGTRHEPAKPATKRQQVVKGVLLKDAQTGRKVDKQDMDTGYL